MGFEAPSLMKHARERDLTELSQTHTPEAIRRRLRMGPGHSYLRDFIYGAIDGIVTTFAIVSGVAGAGLSTGIVMILGFANLIADGFSMAVGNYLGTKAEQQLRDEMRRMEEEHIEKVPQGEREEVRQIFAAKGFKGQELERVVDVITSDKNLWVDTMLKEEWGMTLEGPEPKIAGLSTFSAFFLLGIFPLLSFLLQWLMPHLRFDPFLISAVITGVAFFIVGAFKSVFVNQKWYVAGLETFLVGGIAACLAFMVGVVLRNLVNLG